MKYFFYILTLLLTSTLNAQQNLVPNGSFEVLDSCPDPNAINEQIDVVANWFRPTLATPDLHTKNCPSNFDMGVPINFFGYQKPQDGDNYIGIVIYQNFNVNYREYVEVKIDSVLTAGVKYYWSFYVCLSETSVKAVNNINIAFINNQLINMNIMEFIPLSGVFQPNEFFTDTTNWIKVSGDFIANGDEEYLIIGNFQSDSVINLSTVTPLYVQQYVDDCYYYIDNVCLSTKKECSSIELSVPNVFTPNNDGVNDFFTLVNNQSVKLSNFSIFNRWGNRVYYSETQINWDGTFNQKNCSDGVYFYVINYYQNNQLKSKQGTIHLIR